MSSVHHQCFANRTCSYHEFCHEAGSFLWQIRREGLSYKFFKKMIRPDSCIHHLIPEKRDESILSRLRNLSQYSISLARTERFKRSFVLYALHSFPTDISEDFCDDLIDS